MLASSHSLKHVRTWDFFLPSDPPVQDAFGLALGTEEQLDTDLLTRLQRSPDPQRSDLEVALALVRLSHEEFEAHGTHGSRRTDDESRLLMRTLHAILDRLGITTFDPPFRSFDTFYKYWRTNGGYGSWQARRDMLDEHFEPLRDELDEREARSLSGTLVDPISPRKTTGWASVDEELNEMRRHFTNAVTEQDYSNVGNDAVATLEALSRTVYSHAVHGAQGAPEPPVSNTKERLGCYVEVSLTGPENAELRKLVRSAIELAQATKHRRSGDRRSAGVTADAVLLVANLLRRIDPEIG